MTPEPQFYESQLSLLFLFHPASHYHNTPVFLKFLEVLGKFVLLGISKIPPSKYICTVNKVGINKGLNLVEVMLSMKRIIQSTLILPALWSGKNCPYPRMLAKNSLLLASVGPPRPNFHKVQSPVQLRGKTSPRVRLGVACVSALPRCVHFSFISFFQCCLIL